MHNLNNETKIYLTSIQTYLQRANENLLKNNPQLAATQLKKARRSLEKLNYRTNRS